MATCKYYRQGNCRFGQYCQYEHVNNFGKGRDSKVDSYNEDEYTAVLVAKEVLSAERGGQWMLSCFAPLKDRPCIPGMEDVSPEETRWEIYQAQKNGMVNDAKMHYQQLCRDVKAKREALKNPTREMLTKLKEILGTGKNSRSDCNTTGKSSNFAFATPQLRHTSNNPSTNVFHAFNGSFTASTNTSSIFGKTNTTTNPVFGSTPSFGNNSSIFGGSASSVFGRTTNASTFNTGQSTQTFGTSGSIFGGGPTQPVFGQPSIFGNNQPNNPFTRQTSQTTTSGFNNGAISSPPLFSGASSHNQSNTLFGAQTSTTNLFGGSPNLQTTANSMFSEASSIFPQSEAPAFGGTPVFPSQTTFGTTPAPVFGEKPAFGSSSGAANVFGANTMQATNAFGANAPTPSVGMFASAQGATPASNVSPFGVRPSTTTTAGPFGTASSQFGTTNTTVFSNNPVFPITKNGTTDETFGIAVTSSNAPFTVSNTAATFGTPNTNAATFGTPNTTAAPFGTPNTTAASPFASSTFGEIKASPFGSTSLTTTSTTNPLNQQQQLISPFGTFARDQTSGAVVSGNGSYGQSPFSVTLSATIIDDTVYSMVNQLTDDEKTMFLAEKFCFGKIPLKPPSEDIK